MFVSKFKNLFTLNAFGRKSENYLLYCCFSNLSLSLPLSLCANGPNVMSMQTQMERMGSGQLSWILNSGVDAQENVTCKRAILSSNTAIADQETSRIDVFPGTVGHVPARGSAAETSQ